MNKLWLVASSLVMAAKGIPAYADTAATQPMFGFTSQRALGKICKVDAVLNKADFIAAIPMLKQIGVFDTEIVNQVVINSKPMTLAMTFLIARAPILTQATFDDDNDVQTCIFTYSVLDTDDFGNDRHLTAFTYEFNRSTYEKVNWEKIDDMKFPRITQHFNVGREFQAEFRSEATIR